MDFAVADDSPLGRYLAADGMALSMVYAMAAAWMPCAEIDGAAAGGRSLAALLGSEQPPPSASPAPTGKNGRLRESSTAIVRRNRRRSFFGWASNMRAQAERFIAHWLVDNLTLLDADALREELDELSTCESRVRRWWTSNSSSAFSRAPNILVAGALTAAASAFALALSAAAGWSRVVWYAAAVVVVGVVLIELMYQLMLLLHWVKARQLIAAVQRYVDSKQAFEASYELSLELVKKAEVASRGYRIGPMLPPVGRIEKASSVKCVQLRLQLRRINDAIENASSRLRNRELFVSFTAAATDQEVRAEQDDVTDQRAPSLLISALSKRHELANVLLESALHGAVLDCMSLYWSLVLDEEEENSQKKKQQSADRSKANQVAAFETLRSEFEELARMFAVWNRELDYLNNSRSAKVLRGISVESSNRASADKATATAGGGRAHPQDSTGEPDKTIEALSEQLSELRTACETLKYLVFAAQQDVAVALQSSSVREPTNQNRLLSQSLTETRGLMQTMVGSLSEAWAQYENAIDGLAGAGNGNTHIDSCATGEIAPGDADNTDDVGRQKTLEDEEARLREEQKRNKFTFVFTGTSTGERGFDLKAMLKAQEQQQKSLPAPYFVRELQDVLARRETHAPPSFTKQIDHDNPPAEAAASLQEQLLETAPTMSRATLGGGVTLQSELQSLLYQRTRAASEEFGD